VCVCVCVCVCARVLVIFPRTMGRYSGAFRRVKWVSERLLSSITVWSHSPFIAFTKPSLGYVCVCVCVCVCVTCIPRVFHEIHYVKEREVVQLYLFVTVMK
jgi:hypothetical protein